MAMSFLIGSILLGIGLAMDAFSVSIANGLNEPYMKRGRMCLIAGVYAAFQFFMPMTGWTCVRTIAETFQSFQALIPWIALLLLGYIGGKMLLEGIRKMRECKDEPEEVEAGPQDEACGIGEVQHEKHADTAKLTQGTLLMQGVATSIDALSVGFAIEHYTLPAAFVCCLISVAVTFVICMGGLLFGKRFGERLADKAGILGGSILIGIGLEIFLRSLL